MHKALKRRSVTKLQMWEKYLQKHPDGYKCSQFCEYYSIWSKRVNPVVLRLAECEFVEKNENILITGSTGVGKSYLGTALGYKACIEGYKVSYFNTSKLFAKLKMAKEDGSYLRELAKIEKQDVIILDDFGLQALDSQNRITLLEVIEDRHNKGSIIVTSQIPVQGWYDIIGEKTIADAVLDRLIHQSHRIELHGESMRKKKSINQE